MNNINRQYKDRLFRKLFGSIEMRDNILSLYNALNGTEYTAADELELKTLEDAIYIKMKNDVAFLIDSYLPLWEQQSTYNPNMPVRGFMYFGELYGAYLTEHGCNIYGNLEKATDKAVDRCIEEDVLKSFLLKNKAEVKGMILTEFNEEVFVKGIKEEGIEEGIEEGQSKLVNAVKLLRQGKTEQEIVQMGIDQRTIDLAVGIK